MRVHVAKISTICTVEKSRLLRVLWRPFTHSSRLLETRISSDLVSAYIVHGEGVAGAERNRCVMAYPEWKMEASDVANYSWEDMFFGGKQWEL